MGAGHDGAAKEIASRLAERGVETRIVDFLDASPRLGKFLENAYRLEVERAQWAYQVEFWLWNHFTFPTRFMNLIFMRFFQKRMSQWIHDFSPDLIVSLHPFAAQLMGQMRKHNYPAVAHIPTATFLTDFSVHPLWVHRSVDLHLCVAQTTYESAMEKVGSVSRVVAVGPFVDRRYFTPLSKEQARAELGIPRDSIVPLIVAGSWGVGDIISTFTALALEPGIFPVVACGRNTELLASLKKIGGGLPLGWRDGIHDLVSASDVVIQNAGGLTALEAMAAGRPVVSYRPIAGHGIENTHAMVSAGITRLADTQEDLVEVVRDLALSPNTLVERGRAQFAPAPEQAIIDLLHYAPTKRHALPHRVRALATITAGTLAAFISANVVAGFIGYHGLNLDRTAATEPFVFASVLASPQQLESQRFDNLLSSNEIAAIITWHVARTDPNAVKVAQSRGVTLVNGGRLGTASNFGLLLPDNYLSATRVLLDKITHSRINLNVPQDTINAVTLAWASLHGQSVVPAHIMLPDHFDHHVGPSGIYEYNTSHLTNSSAEHAIESAVARIKANHLVIAPFALISSLPERPA